MLLLSNAVAEININQFTLCIFPFKTEVFSSLALVKQGWQDLRVCIAKNWIERNGRRNASKWRRYRNRMPKLWIETFLVLVPRAYIQGEAFKFEHLNFFTNVRKSSSNKSARSMKFFYYNLQEKLFIQYNNIYYIESKKIYSIFLNKKEQCNCILSIYVYFYIIYIYNFIYYNIYFIHIYT